MRRKSSRKTRRAFKRRFSDTSEQTIYRRRMDLRNRVAELKKGPCADCKRCYPACVMDFDHLPGTRKVNSVSAMVTLLCPWEKIMAEIRKCELVCSNCHRIRTNARQTGL